MGYGKLRRSLARLLRKTKDESGQALFEFTLILALVALLAVVALTALGVAVAGYVEPVADIMGA